jgi:two-component system nitrogen regulation response regulator NtrX
MSADILIVDDEADIRNLIRGILGDEGYATRLAGNARETYAEIEKRKPDLIVLDIWLQGSEQDGLQILSTVKEKFPSLPVVMISGHGTIETAVSSIKKGAYDFIEKPFKADRLLLMIRRALENAALRRENEALKQRGESEARLVGESAPIQQARQVLEKVAASNSRVLLTGEPGTGKDVAARMIYKLSKRANRPFIVLNCATLQPQMLELRLFGSTGNEGERTGVLEEAHGGTLFLDEVADMPIETQGKIVRVLQEQKFQKVGGNKFIEVDVRVLASTNRDLSAEVGGGRFREDLFYRLNVVPVQMAPLREHVDDIPALTEYFVELLCRQSGLPMQTFANAALAVMKAYAWPGNVRQLRNVIEWVLIMKSGSQGRPVEVEDLPPELRGQAGNGVALVSASADLGVGLVDMPLREAREAFEREYLASQVSRFGGNVSKTAEFVGMERSALHRKLKMLQIASEGKDMPAPEKQNNRIIKRA